MTFKLDNNTSVETNVANTENDSSATAATELVTKITNAANENIVGCNDQESETDAEIEENMLELLENLIQSLRGIEPQINSINKNTEQSVTVNIYKSVELLLDSSMKNIENLIKTQIPKSQKYELLRLIRHDLINGPLTKLRGICEIFAEYIDQDYIPILQNSLQSSIKLSNRFILQLKDEHLKMKAIENTTILDFKNWVQVQIIDQAPKAVQDKNITFINYIPASVSLEIDTVLLKKSLGNIVKNLISCKDGAAVSVFLDKDCLVVLDDSGNFDSCATMHSVYDGSENISTTENGTGMGGVNAHNDAKELGCEIFSGGIPNNAFWVALRIPKLKYPKQAPVLAAA